MVFTIFTAARSFGDEAIWLAYDFRTDVIMVSVDHFTYELRSHLRSAFSQGATSILICSRELCKSTHGYCFPSASAKPFNRKFDRAMLWSKARTAARA